MLSVAMLAMVLAAVAPALGQQIGGDQGPVGGDDAVQAGDNVQYAAVCQNILADFGGQGGQAAGDIVTVEPSPLPTTTASPPTGEPTVFPTVTASPGPEPTGGAVAGGPGFSVSPTPTATPTPTGQPTLRAADSEDAAEGERQAATSERA